ncbi:MAG: hypothetical protein J0I95_15200 [Microbacterium sp.]|uniref:hypothetical protein n=1 Tax=unclassified Microbacterium TaxID=2609290 RepID=UPI001AD1D235|nr:MULTISPECIES: hypothetical protein [unclassified Microbacterium]MBN9212846.1 hypothetical protein [Microbacterium sp.]
MEIVRMPLRGETIRSIVATARTRTEYFSVIFDADVGMQHTARREDVPGSVLAERAFFGMSDEAIMIWDAVLPEQARADPVAWFDGNELRDPPPPVRMDATSFDVLPDAEFWPVIESLGGRLWARTLDVAAGRLASCPDDVILRWAHTAGRKAVAVADVLERAGVAPSWRLNAVGAVLGKGRRAYEAVLAQPDAFEQDWMTDDSPQVISLAARALTRKAGRGVQIVTAFTGRQREIDAEEAEEVAAYQRENGIEPRPREPGFRAARAVVEASGVLRERIILVPHGSAMGEAALVALVADGGAVIAGPEFANQLDVGLWGGDAFLIKRRTGLALDEYVRRYATLPGR